MYNFDNWKKSSQAISRLWNLYIEKNSLNREDCGFEKFSSRIEALQTARKSSNFFLFTILYVCLLFQFCNFICIHFKLNMEYDVDAYRYNVLRKIGMSEESIIHIKGQKVNALLFIPLGYSCILGIFFCYFTNFTYGYGWIGVGYAVLVSAILFIIYFLVSKRYKHIWKK